MTSIYLLSIEYMPDYFRNRYRIKSARLPHWDYSRDGWYFVTICTKNRECFFGEILNGTMRYTPIGETAKREMLKTPLLRQNVILDEWVIMPNHIHAIIGIENLSAKTPRVETQCIASLRNTRKTMHPPCMYKNRFGPQRNNLASIIRGLKMAITTQAVKNHIPFAWQPRYHDHLIRTEKELHFIREYIQQNPENWEKDQDHPDL